MYRNELLPKYTKQNNSGMFDPAYANMGLEVPYGSGAVDEAGLNAAIQKAMQEQSANQSQMQGQTASAQSDPNFGSLLRNFTMADRDADPVYQSGLQFGLTEGQKGIDRAFAAKGGVLSGAAAKAMARFGSDYNSTKANESYNRFNNNKSQTFNMLSGVSGTGQVSSNQIANQGVSTGNQIASNQLGAGQARASGYINQNNALQGTLGGLYGAAQKSNPFGSFTPNIAGAGYGGIGRDQDFSDNMQLYGM
jgi:hypothetical protein